ncbi:GATA zinc finger domain-containing protein 14-like [Photinus pyralis]|uniref:GATA zinc finger domain-containing protein 14-like n=1 Tax=Photinus pyralis TaxID=7054 RepID=UPI001267368B|nr:GATA zinc finger domain-containing protein 14-like [Photinus pyralis]
MVKNNCLAYVLLLTLLCYCESRRTHGTGGRRGGHTTPRSNSHTTHNYQRSTEGNIGFERYQPSQNTRQDIGFENVQNRAPQTHGGQPQYQTHYNPVSNSNPSAPLPPANHNYHPASNSNPSAPLPPTNHNTNPQPGPGIGFENVNQRIPQHPHNQQPNNPYNNHQPHYPGSYQGNYNPAGHYNQPYNSYQPPPTYYNPHYSSPGGVSPQIYQPMQQSSGGSLLGYAGTFAGGALIGHLLTSNLGGGGGGSNNNGDRQYSVHHYYHDANAIPKQMSVSTNSLLMCNKNETQGLCVPNTFAICLSNGTIMCVTHSMYTTPCGGGNNLTCVITVLPCASNDTSCNATTGGNSTTSAVYIPCISNVTVSQQNVVTSDANSSSNQNVQYCVTAIAEPKKLESTVTVYANFLQELAKAVYQMTIADSTESPVITSEDKSNKTEVTTLMPTALNNENKTEITTLPYRM